MRMHDLDDLVGLLDIANELGVTRAAVANWRTRHRDTFPAPILTISNGTPIFSRREVMAWATPHGRAPTGRTDP